MLAGFICLMTVMSLCMTVVFYALYDYSRQKQSEIYMEQTLALTRHITSLIQEQLVTIGSHLISDHQIFALMYGRTRDRLLEYHVFLNLNSLQAEYPFLYAIGVYNASTDMYLSTIGLRADDERDILTQLMDMRKPGQYRSVPRMLKVPSPTANMSPIAKRVITIPIYLSYAGAADASMLVLYLDVDYLDTLTTTATSLQRDTTVMIADASGRVLSGSNPALFGTLLTRHPELFDAIADGTQSAPLQIEMDGEHRRVYASSSAAPLNWTYIVLEPRSHADSLRSGALSVAAVAGILLLVFSALVLRAISRSFYRPLQSLVNQFHSDEEGKDSPIHELNWLGGLITNSYQRIAMLQNSLDIASPVVKGIYLRSLLSGEADAAPEIRGLLNQAEISLSGQSFAVAVMRPDPPAYTGNGAQPKVAGHERNAYLYRAINIAEETLKKCCECNTIIQDDRIVIILQFQDREAAVLRDEAPLALDEVIRACMMLLGVSYSIGLGESVPDRKLLPDSLRNAYEALEQTFFSGTQQLIPFSPEAPRKEPPGALIPVGMELIRFLHQSERQKMPATLQAFVSALRQMTTAGAREQMRLLQTQVRETLEHHPLGEEERRLLEDGTIWNPNYWADIPYGLAHAMNQLSDALQSRKVERSLDIMRGIEEYIAAQYGDPQLSIDRIADSMRLTGGYIGKLYKAMTCNTITERITQVRLENACALLKGTQMPIAVIAGQIGIENNSYFFALFKKHMKMTPTEYRRKHADTRERAGVS